MLERYRPVSLDEFSKVLSDVLDTLLLDIAKGGENMSLSNARALANNAKNLLIEAYDELPDWIKLDEEYAFELAYQTGLSAMSELPSVLEAGIVATTFNKIPKKQIDTLLDPKRFLGSTGLTIEDMVTGLQSQHTQRVRQILAKGVTARQTPTEITTSIKELFEDVKRHKVDAIVRTAIIDSAHVARQTIDKEFDEVIIGFHSVATLDNRTTPICISLHNKKYLKKNNETASALYKEIADKPPRHPRCRSILLRLTKDSEELFEDTEVTATIWNKDKKRYFEDGGQSYKKSNTKKLTADSSFQDFFETLTLKEQATIVGGINKAKLMQAGKLSLSQVLREQRDGRVKYLTNGEILKMINAK